MKATLPIGIALALTFVGFGASTVVNQVFLRSFLALPDGEAVAELGEVPEAPTAEPDGGEDKPRVSRTRIKSRSQYIDMIVGNNLFDHESIGKTPTSSGEDAEESDLQFVLLATMVASPASFSTALLVPEGEDDGLPDAYGLGDRLGDAEIIAISKWDIRIRRADGKEEVLKLELDKTEASRRPSRSSKDDDEGDEDGQIRKTGPTSWEVDRDLVDKHLANIDGIARLGRAIPHRGSDGQIDGYRLSGIRRGTVGQKLGLRNGDIVHGVNGYDLSSMAEAMTAFQELQSESNLKFDITRRGKKQTNSYSVR